MKKTEKIEKFLRKFLGSYDGTTTVFLESVFGDLYGELSFEVLRQEVVEADRKLASKLGVEVGEKVILRNSVFRFKGEPVCFASLFSPADFLNSLGSADTSGGFEGLKKCEPIGQSIKNVETRREMLWSVTTTDVKTHLYILPEYKRILIDYNAVCGEPKPWHGEIRYLIRNYRIIHGGKTVFDVIEVFNLDTIAVNLVDTD